MSRCMIAVLQRERMGRPARHVWGQRRTIQRPKADRSADTVDPVSAGIYGPCMIVPYAILPYAILPYAVVCCDGANLLPLPSRSAGEDVAESTTSDSQRHRDRCGLE
jgi:hypothetical protein